MKWRYQILSLILLTGIIAICFAGWPIARMQVKNDAYAYLLENGYSPEEIAEVKGKYDWLHDGKYYAEVQLSAQEEKIYLYYDGEENIYQQIEK